MYVHGMVMSGRSVNVTTLFLGRPRPPKQLTSAKVHILSPVTLLDSAERETKLSSRTGYRTSDLWFLSQLRSLMAYAKFHYSLNVLFCERIANINKNFTCTVLPDFVLC